MKSSLAPLLAFFLAFPSFALANEPGKGTLIMISSLGLWTLGGVIWMRLAKSRRQSPHLPGQHDPANSSDEKP